MKLYNTLTHQLEEFIPLDKNNIRMYVCGPTVYDRAHVGNARPAVIFDILYRVLQSQFNCVTYVRNITDIDDKIYKTSNAIGIDISKLTSQTTDMYHEDIVALNVKKVDIEPRATAHIRDIIEFIKRIVQNGYAYQANGHVYFDTSADKEYGRLADIKNRISGARIDISDNKRNPMDFVLWKPVSATFPIGWDSPWGKGRPGWHIECSAMSCKYLGQQFDIHGGGSDLIFPHHENEIAQSYAVSNRIMAKYWIHNGHVLINGTKMSKSLGNFYTVHDLLAEFPGEVMRLALMLTHYRSPINFTKNLLLTAQNILNNWYSVIRYNYVCGTEINQEVLTDLSNDLNTPKAIASMYKIVNKIKQGENHLIPTFVNTAQSLLGLLQANPEDWFKRRTGNNIDTGFIEKEIKRRELAKANKDYITADAIRANLIKLGISLQDTPSGTKWKNEHCC